VKLANMLAAVTGMRNGEILALRLQDLGSDCIYVRSSWNKADGMKLPKNNKTRIVQIPFPGLMNYLIEMAKLNQWYSNPSPDSFVFWSTNRKNVPMQGQNFGRGLREALQKVGFTSEQADLYDFHGWRHFFTSYMAGKLERKLLKGETGHLTDIMIDRYSDHETVGEKELIQAKKIETFAELLPEQSNMLILCKVPQRRLANKQNQ
jgi:integrase